MHAIRQHTFGPAENLVFEEVDDPMPGAGQVRITVTAAGMHVVDTTIRAGESRGPFPPPDFIQISHRMRSIALQSAVGGILSIGGMVFEATGHLSPVGGAISQEVIDVLAVLNALRAAFPPKVISDL